MYTNITHTHTHTVLFNHLFLKTERLGVTGADILEVVCPSLKKSQQWLQPHKITPGHIHSWPSTDSWWKGYCILHAGSPIPLQSNPLKWTALGPDYEYTLRQSMHLSMLYTLRCVQTRTDKWYPFKRTYPLKRYPLKEVLLYSTTPV